MKRIKFLSWMFIALLTSISMASCSDDDDVVPEVIDEQPARDVSDIVAGVYSGKLVSGGYVTSDAYIVTLTRMTSTAVKVEANFFSESPIFNVEKEGSQYKLTNTSDYSNVSMYVSNETLNISFVNALGTMTSYVGNK